MSTLYVLFEFASGLGLFERVEFEEIGHQLPQVQEACLDLTKFGKLVKLKAFAPFKNAEHALENINHISEGVVNEYLKHFLELNLAPTTSKHCPTYQLVMADSKLAAAIQEELHIPCQTSELGNELIRGIRLHFSKFIKKLKEGDLEKAQLGLGHSYSRAKVKFNVHRADNMVIQAISILDQLDKDINTFAMRCKEWYSWHFPELPKIISDNYLFARLVKYIKNKSRLTDEHLSELEAITLDSAKAKQILDAARSSMGTDIAEIDMININQFSERVIALADYRRQLHEYLIKKMHDVSPNLSALVGELVSARLISHAGSLTNLSKYPASTVQILGAEKALFRALKTHSNTPKYGLLFHSSFITRAAAKNKGRISRYLANKCSMASRIDCYSDQPTDKFGEALRAQVEERLKFLETGVAPRKNLDVMSSVTKELLMTAASKTTDLESKKRKPEEDSTLTSPRPKQKQEKISESMMMIPAPSIESTIQQIVPPTQSLPTNGDSVVSTSEALLKKEKKHKKDKKDKKDEKDKQDKKDKKGKKDKKDGEKKKEKLMKEQHTKQETYPHKTKKDKKKKKEN